jgi:hypothetical protein
LQVMAFWGTFVPGTGPNALAWLRNSEVTGLQIAIELNHDQQSRIIESTGGTRHRLSITADAMASANNVVARRAR